MLPNRWLSFLVALAVVFGVTAARAHSAQTPGLPSFGRPSGPPAAARFNDSRDQVSAKVYLSATDVTPGADVVAAVVLNINSPWHMWPRAGPWPKGSAQFEGAVRTELTSINGLGVVVHSDFAQWPETHFAMIDIGDGPQNFAIYEGLAPVFVPITIASDAAPGQRSIKFSVSFQTCDERTCLQPATYELTAEFNVVGAGTSVSRTPDPIFKQFDAAVFAKIRSGEKAPQLVEFNVLQWSFSIDTRGAGFVALLLVAAVGGFLLNLTPCVLPVIPLKIMGLSSAAGTRRRTLILGAFMSLGVIAFWMSLGIAVSSIKGFTSANQLFQYPWFVIFVGVFIATMAVGLLGFFNVGLPQWIYMINPKQESAPGAFGFGIMTAILSTPCTAPLMGAAIAWAATQSTTTVLAVFAAVGIGMAIPYLVLAAFPQLTAKMPKSGPASDVIKQVMALLLLAAAAYFIGAGLSGLMVTPPDPPSKLFWWFVAAAACSAGGWLVVRTVQITPKLGRRAMFGGLGLAIIALSLFVGFSQSAKGPIVWTYYTPDRLAIAKGRGDVVVIDFTAEWCLNCKVLEATVLNQPGVARELNGKNVTAIKVDLTGNNGPGNELLKSFDRITIPLLVVLDSQGNVVFKSDTYGPQQVLDAIAKARGDAAPPAVAMLGQS